MILAQDSIADIIMRVVALPGTSSAGRTDYSVLVYANHPVPGLSLVGPTQLLNSVPALCQNFPLQAIESLDARSLFRGTESLSSKGVSKMEDGYDRRLSSMIRDYLSPDLAKFLENPPPLEESQEGYRVWWDCESTPLALVPWEIIVGDSTPAKLYFVRGLPQATNDPSPSVPLHGKLKLAVIGQRPGSRWNEKLWEPLRETGRVQIDIFNSDESAGLALRHAVTKEYDLIHVIAQGTVSPGYDGILYLGGYVEQQMAGSTLRLMLESSKITALAFTFPDDTEQGGRQTSEASSSYQAFAAIANTHQPGPSMTTQLRRCSATTLMKFWETYYSELATTGNILKATDSARRAAVRRESSIAIALFLAHRTGQLYEHIEDEEAASIENSDFYMYKSENVAAQIDSSFYADNVQSSIKESAEQSKRWEGSDDA